MFIFDSFALIVLFERQNGWQIVHDLIEQQISRGSIHLISAINFGEFYYLDAVKHGYEHAEQLLEIARQLPLQIHVPTFEDIMEAAHLKGGSGASYADCFAAALALKENAAVLTGDPDFRRLEEFGVKVEWLPKNR